MRRLCRESTQCRSALGRENRALLFPESALKTFAKITLGALVAVALAGTAGWLSLDKETRGLLKTLPTNRDLLFWNEAQRDAAAERDVFGQVDYAHPTGA